MMLRMADLLEKRDRHLMRGPAGQQAYAERGDPPRS
jgi:hypothetical protein